MRPVAKLSIVGLGYLAAFAAAWIVVELYILATSNIDRQTYSGMSAFGDSLVFLGALGVASVPATGAALYFLRQNTAFWRLLCGAVLIFVSTGVAGLLSYAAPGFSYSLLGRWADLAPLRILVSPVFALFFLLSGLIAPNRSARVSLIAATVVEVVVFVVVVAMWLHPMVG